MPGKAERLAELLRRVEAKDLKAGPGLHEAAMDAARRGDTSEALDLMKRLQNLLELDDESFSRMLGQSHRGPKEQYKPAVEPDLDRPIGERRRPDSLMRGKAEGGSVDKEDRPALSWLRSVGQSMAGAVPFKGDDPEFVDYWGDVITQVPAGLMSQWMGINPTTGELEYAGPLSDMIHAPYPNEELLRYDPEAYYAMVENFKKRRSQTSAIPGIVDETMALPLLGEILGTGTAPELSHEAGRRADALRQRIREEIGLGEPTGFPQHLAESLGVMGGQLPVPASMLRKAPSEVAKRSGALARTGRILGATPKAGVEFLSPIIEPRIGNYVAGALFGGGIGTLVEPGEIPPDIQDLVSAAEAGDEEAYNQLVQIYEEYQAQQEETARRQESSEQTLEQIGQSGAFSKGGDVKKLLTRRDILKGMGAAGVTGIAGGKAALRSAEPEVALKQIEEAIGVASPMKNVKSVTERLTQAPTATFRVGDLSKSLTTRLRKVLNDYFDSQEGYSKTELEELYPRAETQAMDTILTDVNEGWDSPLDKDGMEHLESVLDEAVDDLRLSGSSEKEVQEVEEVLQKLRNAPALDFEEFFDRYAEASWDRPSAFYEYQERLGISPEKQVELPMRGDLGDLDEMDWKKLEEIFGEEGIPARLDSSNWDT